MTTIDALARILIVLLSSGGPLPLLLAGSLLIPAAWVFLARRPPPYAYSHAGNPAERLWLRLIGGAALGEVTLYLSTATINLTATGSVIPLLVPFSLPSALLLGTLLGAVCGGVSAHRHWRAEGVVAYLGLGFLAMGFIEYSWVILHGNPFGPGWGLALFFLVTELFGMCLLLLYQFYALEFLAGSAPVPRERPPPLRDDVLPYVAIQVASYNEPLEIVERCLESVRALDYPPDRLYLQLLDDSTDPGSRIELERVCRRLGIEFRHREHRRGFKAGALNDGMATLPKEVELIAVVDADYRVAPRFLRRTVPYFQDPQTAWVQTPQSYWNEDESAFTRLYSLADAYFYRVIQPVRREANSSIFCGTMGVLRRSALTGVGGWDEACITEDAEVSLRLYAAGWRSEYLTEVLGAGMAPDRFPALRSQFSRWAFGGLQLLRRNVAALRSPRLSLRQRADFLASGAFWMDGVFLLAMAGGLLALVAAVWTGIAWSVPSPSLLVGISLAPLLLVTDGVVKTRLALGRVRQIDLRDAVGVMGFWYALKLTNLRASLRGLAGKPTAFQRTPKSRGRVVQDPWFAMLRPTWPETVLAAGIGLAALAAALSTPSASVWNGFGRVVLVAWLGYYAVTFAAAPLLNLVARRPASRSRGGVVPSQVAVGDEPVR